MELLYFNLILLLLFSSPIISSSLKDGYQVDLNHIDSNQNFTRTELIHRAINRTKQMFSNKELLSSKNITISLNNKDYTIGEYTMDLEIGTPPLKYSSVMDTGSDLIWTQCTPCEKCVSQPTPIYNPKNSSTFFSICNNDTTSCWYNQTYGKGWTSGVIDKETFTFGTTNSLSVPNITFGCSNTTSDAFSDWSGIVGFGRGEMSLVSQLKTDKFSYCLTSFLETNTTNLLLLGSSAKINASVVKTTPFVKNPPGATHYYLSLTGISLGTNKLPIKNTTFALNSDGTGGIIIDSGTTFSTLTSEAYQAVVDGIQSLVKLPTTNALGSYRCYILSNNTSPPKMPNMTFHFEGADMEFPVENYMFSYEDYWCLAMMSGDTLSGVGGVSIFGNYQQQNMHILYDLKNKKLSFAPVQCDKL